MIPPYLCCRSLMTSLTLSVSTRRHRQPSASQCPLFALTTVLPQAPAIPRHAVHRPTAADPLHCRAFNCPTDGASLQFHYLRVKAVCLGHPNGGPRDKPNGGPKDKPNDSPKDNPNGSHTDNLNGSPNAITDSGQCFIFHLVKTLCVLFGGKQSMTSPYHLASNSACESKQPNEIMLSAQVKDDQTDWPSILPGILMAFLNTPAKNSTEFSPYFLLFCQHMKLPLIVPYKANSLKSLPTSALIYKLLLKMWNWVVTLQLKTWSISVPLTKFDMITKLKTKTIILDNMSGSRGLLQQIAPQMVWSICNQWSAWPSPLPNKTFSDKPRISYTDLLSQAKARPLTQWKSHSTVCWPTTFPKRHSCDSRDRSVPDQQSRWGRSQDLNSQDDQNVPHPPV